LKPKKVIHLKQAVSLIRYVDGNVGVIDKKNTFRLYSGIEYKLLGGFKINLPENRPLENSVAISPRGNYLAIAVTGKNKTTIWDVRKKKLIHTLGWHKGEVVSISFDYDENYVLTGGTDGRAYIWSIELGKMVTSLPPHPDYILASGFSKNSLWVATGSFDKLISITNISSFGVTYRKKSHRGAVTKIDFLTSHKMVSGDKTGEIIVWDYTKGNIIQRLQSVADMVVDLATDTDEEYLFAITKDKNIYLYDLNSYELVNSHFIKLTTLPSSITFVPDTNELWIGTLDGSIYIYNLLEDEDKLARALEKKEYALIYEYVKENPLLKRTKEYERVEKIWEETLEEAYKLLEAGELNKAKEILNPFLNVPSKRPIIQSLLKDFVEFEKFKTAVLKRKYPLAYSLANQYPSFKETVYYKKMEEDWRKTFNKVKELIKMKGKEDVVKQLLAPFRGVSQKTPLIQALFNDKQLYDLLKNFLRMRKFEEFFKLISKYPFLRDTPEFEQAEQFAKKIYKAAMEAVKKGDFKKAISYAEWLKEFPEYKDKAEQIIEDAEIISKFISLIASKNYDQIEKMVYNYPFLEDSDDYKRLKKDIDEKIKAAEKEAFEGEIAKVAQILKDILNSELYRQRVLNIIKSAYLNQLLKLLIQIAKTNKGKKQFIKGVNNYISYFGFDNEIEDLVQKAKALALEVPIKSMEKSRNLDFNNLPQYIWEAD